MSAARSPSHLLPSIAVAVCGLMWGGFWYPLRWFTDMGVGGAWVSLIFNLVAIVSPLPWLLRRQAWGPDLGGKLLTGLLLGTAFSLYTVSLVMTDVIHAILLFYLTPVWSTLAGWMFMGERLSAARGAAMAMGFAGMACILGIDEGLPLPRNAGDWTALASGMLWSAGTLRSYMRPSTAIALPVFAFSFGGLLSSLAALAGAAAVAHPMAQVADLAATAPWIVLLALVIFVPPNFLVLWAAQRIDPGRVGILLMTEVLAGSITAALFSGEAFGPLDMAGTTLIVLAGLVEVLGRSTGQPAPELR